MSLNIKRRGFFLRIFCLRVFVCLTIAGLLVACAGSSVRNPVPESLSNQVTALDLTNARFWGDEIPKNFNEMIRTKSAQMRAARPHLFKRGARPTISFLTISGGGSDGAFGAGLLVGWSDKGTRPEFEIVTGVSTGALSAPFAFLGKQYDPVLKEIYTKYSTKDLLTKHPVRGLIGGSSMAGSKPLAGMIAKYVDQAFMAEIAKAHGTGRRLLIGTTNLDEQRPVIWDMGEIASSGRPEAIHLFRNILLASASIPGAFPPVFLNVVANGKTYDEMHVDGGTTHQVFLLPGQVQAGTVDRRSRFQPRRQVFIIRNGRIGPERKVIKASTLSIAKRSVSTLIKYQGVGDLFQLYEFTKRNKIKFRLSYIPADFPDTSTEPFDTVYMTKLYNLSHRLGKQGYRWQKTPPGAGRR